MHTHFFIFTFFIFLFFYFFIFWAGLGRAQPAQPGHWPKPVTRLGLCKWIKIHLHSAKWKVNKLTLEKKKIAYHSAARFVSFLPLCSCDSANGWFPCLLVFDRSPVLPGFLFLCVCWETDEDDDIWRCGGFHSTSVSFVPFRFLFNLLSVMSLFVLLLVVCVSVFYCPLCFSSVSVRALPSPVFWFSSGFCSSSSCSRCIIALDLWSAFSLFFALIFFSGFLSGFSWSFSSVSRPESHCLPPFQSSVFLPFSLFLPSVRGFFL